MNFHIREVRKHELPNILEDKAVWDNSFLKATPHRLLAHLNNPNLGDDDIALLITFLDNKIIGYMGIYIDHIHIGGEIQKIGWLSTWWLHPSTARKGIGKEMLKKMYDLNHGKIGISQFTPSAKRVYDKSGYFYYLKKLEGCKIDLSFNLGYLLPAYRSYLKSMTPIFRFADTVFNALNSVRLGKAYRLYEKSLEDISIDYLTYIDDKTRAFLSDKQKNNLTQRDGDFFQYIKTFQWIEEAPLLDLVNNNYSFSGYNQNFNIYLVKVENENSEIMGFVSLLRKDHDLKVLQVFYENEKHPIIAKMIIMHGIKLKVKTIITYDEKISNEFKQLKQSRIRYKKKTRESIISKAYGEIDYSKFDFQYGDGDCSFA